MRISLCIITKNEENNIRRCIESIGDIVFEKIIVDTGSKDKTIEIAKSMGCKVYSFEWIDDFAAARNYAISIAKGDWIIFLDADEYFEKSKQLLLLKKIKEADKFKCDCIIAKLINMENSTDEKSMKSVVESIRIFKNDKNIRYIGAIHEYIRHKVRNMKAYKAFNDIVIYHTGYSKEEIKRKDKGNRNLSLLYKELKKNDNAQINFYIAESLMLENDYSKALEFLENSKNNKQAPSEKLRYSIYCRILVCMICNDSSLEEVYNIYEEAIKYDANCPDFYKYFADMLLKLGKYKEAIAYYEICLEKIEIYDYSFESHVLSRISNLYEELLNLYVITKDDRKITKITVQMIKVQKYDYKSLLILIRTLAFYEKEDDIYEFIMKLYDRDSLKDILMLIKVSKSLKLDILEGKVLSLLTKEQKEEYIKALKNINEDLEAFEEESREYSAEDCYRRGEFYNVKSELIKSKFMHKKAFEKKENICASILNENHPNYNYIYDVKEELIIENCPICSKKAIEYSVYNTVASIDFVKGFNPIRTWMYCEVCHHIFANNYPSNIGALLNESDSVYEREPNFSFVHINDKIINSVKKYNKGKKFLEIGVGAGEMLAVALEHEYDVKGIDIRYKLAKNIEKLLGVEVLCEDFLDFNSENKFDVICMGDVIEHMTNPIVALEKIHSLLNKEGILWISTPNFDSAFSRIYKHNDPMWKVVEHINYFSFKSLSKILKNIGFEVMEYKISERYNGCMELIVKKCN